MGKSGGSPPPAPTQTQVVRSEIPDFFRPFLEDIFRRSSAISEEAYVPPPERGRLQEVGEQTLAPIDPAQQAALDRLKSTEMAETGVSAIRGGQGLALTGSDIATAGAQRIGGEEIREAMNPFQQAVTDIAIREELRRAEPQRQAIRAQAARSNAFGSSRGTLLETEFERNLGQRLADIQTTGGAAAFDRATQRLEQERQRQIGAGQAVSGIGGQLAGLGAQEAGVLSAGVGRQLAAGEAQRGLQTEAIGRGLEEFQREVDYPKQQIGFYSGILRGYQPPMNTYTQTATPFSATQQMLGQAAAAGAIGKGFGLFNDGGIVGLAFGGAPSQQYTESVGDDKGLSSMVGNPVASYAPGGITRIGSGPNFQVMSQDDLYSLAGRATPNDPNTSALIEEFQRRRLPVPPALGKSMTQSRADAGVGSAPPVILAPTDSVETSNSSFNIIKPLKPGEEDTSGYSREDKKEDITTNIRPPTMAIEVGTGKERNLDQEYADAKAKREAGIGSVAGMARATVRGMGPTPGEEKYFSPENLEQSIKTTQQKAGEKINVVDKKLSNLDNLAKKYPNDPRISINRQKLLEQKDQIKKSTDERVAKLRSLIAPDTLPEGATDIDLQTSGPVTPREKQQAAATDPSQKLVMPTATEKKLPPNMKRKTSKTEEEEGPLLADDEVVGGFNMLPIEEAKPAADDAAPAAEPKKAEDLTDWFGLAAAALAAGTGREEGLTNAAKLLSQVKRPEDIALDRAQRRYIDVKGQSDLIDAIAGTGKSALEKRKFALDLAKFRNTLLKDDREAALNMYKEMDPELRMSLNAKLLAGKDIDELNPDEIIDAFKANISKFRTIGKAAGGVVPDDLKDRYGITSIQRI